jgi:hypothetical protein
MAELARDEPGVARAYFGVLLLVAGVGTLTGDRYVWAYVTVWLVVAACVATAHAAARFSPALLWSLIALGVLHLAGGLLPYRGTVVYDAWIVDGVLRYDQAVHAFGSVCATWVSWQLLGAYLDLSRTPARAQGLLACLGGLGKGAVNEVLEFLTTSAGGGEHVGGYANTGWDLVFDLAGCVAAAVFLVQSRAARRSAVALAVQG